MATLTTTITLSAATTTTMATTTTTTSNVNRALYYASRIGDAQEVQRLVQIKGAQVEFAYPWIGQTSLWMACCFGHVAVVEYLVTQAGATLHCPDLQGRTPLFVACESGQVDMVRLLIKLHLHGQAQKRGNTSLPTSSKCFYSCRDKHGRTPFFVACEQGHLDVAQFLYHNVHSDAVRISMLEQADHLGRTPLHVASTKSATAMNDDHSNAVDNADDGLAMAQFLLDTCGANVHATTRLDCQTPLHMAVASGNCAMVNLLIAHGASFASLDQQGCTPYLMTMTMVQQLQQQQNNNSNICVDMVFFLMREHNMMSVLRT